MLNPRRMIRTDLGVSVAMVHRPTWLECVHVVHSMMFEVVRLN